MDEINKLVKQALDPNLGERVAAGDKIKELRLHGSPEDNARLMNELGTHLFDLDKAIYAGEALLKLGDPSAVDMINDARNMMDTRGMNGVEVWHELGEIMKKLYQTKPSTSAEDAIKKLDEEANPKPLTDKAAAKAADKMVKDLFPKTADNGKPRAKNR